MKNWIRNVAKVRDTPEAIARGLAIGFFFGVSLLWGLQILFAVFVSHWARGNKVIAAAMTVVSNPLTNLPLYGVSYLLGHFIIGGKNAPPDFSRLQSLQDVLDLGPRFLASMVVGTTLIGLIGAVLLYFAAQPIMTALRRFTQQRADNASGGAAPI
jgi:uncharacterized protein (DUF2062 family)